MSNPPESDDAIWLSSTGYKLLKEEQERRRRWQHAVAEAHRERPDLSDDEFEILASHSALSGNWESAPAEILSTVNAHRPPAPARAPGRRPGRPPLDESEVAQRLDEALQAMAERDRRAGISAGSRRPSREEIAHGLGIHVRTLNDWAARFPSVRSKLP